MNVAADDVVITGIGVVLPRCDTQQRLWQQLRDGEPQLRLEVRPDAPHLKCAMGRIREFDPDAELGGRVPGRPSRYPRDIQLYLTSVLRAMDDAGLARVPPDPYRTGVFDGTSRGSHADWDHRVRAEAYQNPRELYTRRELAFCTPGQAAGLAAAIFGTRGPAYTFTSSCSAASIAIGHAAAEIRSGNLDVALASGHESVLIEPVYRMYAEAGLLSEECDDPSAAVRPYRDHSGNAFGEGAVTLVLESRRHASRRGTAPIAELGAYAYANSGFHPTRVDASGEVAARAVTDLLGRARLDAGAVDFVVGHGNAVRQSDLSELAYMRLVFGDRAGDVPLISTKPIYGHTFGASGAINLAAAALMIHHGYVIPTPHAPSGAGARPLDVGLSITYGLGGHHAALLVRRDSESTRGT